MKLAARDNRRVHPLDLYRLQERLRGDVVGEQESWEPRYRGRLVVAIVVGIVLALIVARLMWMNGVTAS